MPALFTNSRRYHKSVFSFEKLEKTAEKLNFCQINTFQPSAMTLICKSTGWFLCNGNIDLKWVKSCQQLLWRIKMTT